MISYEDIAKRFVAFNCKLLTTHDEFKENNMNADSKFRVLMSCGHEREFYRKHLAKNNLCKDCTYLKSKNEVFYERMVKRFADVNCTLLTTKEEYINNNMDITSSYNFIASCGHNNNAGIGFLAKNPEAICKECAKKKKYNEMRLPYTEVSKRFTDNGCKLLTTEKEYYDNGMTIYSQYKMIASCGHERECTLNIFQDSDISLCSPCARKKDSDFKKENSKIDGNARGNVLEYNAYIYLEKQLNEYFDIKKLREGTLADCLIKPKSIDNDEWLQIQIKSTKEKQKQKKSRENYCHKFTFNSKYKDIVICCICVNDNSIYTFDGELSLTINNIGINENSKYYSGIITDGKIIDRFISHYNNNKFPKVKYLEANIPISFSHKIEYEYQQLREEKLGSHFEFMYPELEGQVFDFTIDKFKIQEKVGSIRTDVSIPCIEVHLSKNAGLGKQKRYDIGDNHFYWIACPDKDTFYIFPESILVEKQYILQELETSDTSYKCMYLHFKATRKEDLVKCQSNDEWTFPYRYNYSNLDISKLKLLFNMMD
jgi:hypothetical protein